MESHSRKLQRLKDYDYTQNNAYFITICTQNRDHILGLIEKGSFQISQAGRMIEERFLNISNNKGITINKYCMMPNHIHAIIIVERTGTTQGSFPTLSGLVQRFKTITTRLYIDGVKSGAYPPFYKKIWQKSYYDHIIRNEKSYDEIWQYIDTNPRKWQEDELYNKQIP